MGQPVWEWSFIDGVQTVFLILMAGTLIYAVWKIGNALEGVMNGLRDPLLVVVRDNEEIHRQLAAVWVHVEAIEDRERAAEEAKKARPDGPDA